MRQPQPTWFLEMLCAALLGMALFALLTLFFTAYEP